MCLAETADMRNVYQFYDMNSYDEPGLSSRRLNIDVDISPWGNPQLECRFRDIYNYVYQWLCQPEKIVESEWKEHSEHGVLKFAPVLQKILVHVGIHLEDDELGIWVRRMADFVGRCAEQPKLRLLQVEELRDGGAELLWRHLYVQPTCSADVLADKTITWLHRELAI